MNTGQHTPTPWETSFYGETVSPPKGDWSICAEGGGDMVASLAGCVDQEANAKFIVGCCNAHDELVKQLLRARNYLGDTQCQLSMLIDIDKALAKAGASA